MATNRPYFDQNTLESSIFSRPIRFLPAASQPKAGILNNNFSTLLSDMYSQIWLNVFLCTNGYATTYFTKVKKNTKPLIPVHIVKMFVSNCSNYGVPYLFIYLCIHSTRLGDWVN